LHERRITSSDKKKQHTTSYIRCVCKKAMSSITSSVSENTIKLDYLGSPVSHIVRPYSNIHGDIDTKSVGSKSVGSRTSKLTYSGKIRMK
jgi:hypothetical protein